MEYRRVPTGRLTARLRLERYDERPHSRILHTDPGRVELLMKQHAGSPAVPVVDAGDSVGEGDLVGEARGEVSARVHASVAGRVLFADDTRVILERR
jgi:Na+-translocating ferredoxin:NAD+ oxidoreductase RnfC subunit